MQREAIRGLQSVVRFVEGMRLNTVIRTSAVATIVAAASLLLASNAQSPPSAFVPFTAHVVEEHFASAAAKVPVSVDYITVERRSDGSEATSTTIDSPVPSTLGDILDVPSRKHITLDSLADSTMTLYLSSAELRRELDRRHRQDDLAVGSEHSTILGYDVVRYQARYGSQRRWETHDEWMSPELAGFVLEGVFRTCGGAWNQTTVKSITTGEPSSSMFTVAPGYVERSPMQLEKVYAAEYSGAAWLPPDSLQRLERTYETHQTSH